MSDQKPTDGYADRLKEARQWGPKPMSVRELAREVRAKYKDLRGASYGGIRQYADGAIASPRIDLLKAIAHVLQVRPEWLAFGNGTMTEAAEVAARASSGAVAAVGDPGGFMAPAEDVQRAFVEGLPVLKSGASAATWQAIADLYDAFFDFDLDRVSKSMRDRKGAARQLQVQVAKETTSMIAAAATAGGIDLEAVSRWQLERYVHLTVQAISMLLVQPHRIAGRPGATYTIARGRDGSMSLSNLQKKGGRNAKA